MTIRNDTVVIAGNIGNDPSRGVTRTGKPVINFRVASTPGYFDQRTGAWVEGDTSWYAISAFGNRCSLSANPRFSRTVMCG